MIAPSPDSDGEIGSETLNSSQSSMSSGSCERCSSFSRLSFDAATAASPPPTTAAGRMLSASSKPHSSSGPLWTAIKSRRNSAVAGELGPRDFQLLHQIGSGDIGTVYLCRLRDEHSFSLPPAAAGAPASLFAMKVVDKTALAKRKKLERAATEKKILRALDHPFLPTLYADFDASPHYSCVVMEYCAGGDLHSLRHRQPNGRFSLAAVRFYAAEVLLALEYLHLLGIVYRDLKPENILIRSDGHIMLSDFDLSLQSSTSPALEPLTPPACSAAGGETPSCLPRLRQTQAAAACGGWQFVAEPMEARSHSFVGTHEYVAPEVAAGEAHGAAVDWWAYGVLLYELLHGRTPFAGPTNEATLRNILHQHLAFPGSPRPSASTTAAAARDLISDLLVRDPAARFGSRLGAAEVKAHPFFKGLNFALLRAHRPPVVPGPPRPASCKVRTDKKPAQFDFF